MNDNIYGKCTKVKILQCRVNATGTYGNIEEKLTDFISNHDVIEIKQSLCHEQNNLAVLLYTIFYNEYVD